jgi:hypothetical protein
MAPDRLRARRLYLPFALAFVVSVAHGFASCPVQAQPSRARGDYDKAIPVAPPQATPQQAPPQQVAPQPAPAQAVPRQAPSRPAPSGPPVIIWNPSDQAGTPRETTAPADPAAAPRAAAESFYRTYLQLRPTGLPNATQRQRLRGHLSPGLEAALSAATKAEANSVRQGGGPLQDGDVFTSLADGAGNASIRECEVDADRYACTVRLTAAQGANAGTEWQDKVFLTRTPTGWRVDDVSFGGRFALGNHGTLTDLLTILVRQMAPTPQPPGAAPSSQGQPSPAAAR